MKTLKTSFNLFILFCILFSISVSAQEERRTIQVIGEYKYTPKIEKFVIFYQISLLEDSPYNGIEGKSVEEVEAEFRKLLKENGIDEKKLEENLMMRVRSGNSSAKFQKFCTFETESETDIYKLLDISQPGVTIYDFSIEPEPIDTEAFSEYVKQAELDAHEKAKQSAKKMGLKIGDLFKISTSNYSTWNERKYEMTEQFLLNDSKDFELIFYVVVDYELVK